MKPTSCDELLSVVANVLATVYPERSDRANQLLERTPLIKQKESLNPVKSLHGR